MAGLGDEMLKTLAHRRQAQPRQPAGRPMLGPPPPGATPFPAVPPPQPQPQMPYATGNVRPPETPAWRATIPSSGKLPDWSSREILDHPSVFGQAEPWSTTTGNRDAYMQRAFRGYTPGTSTFSGADPEGRPISSPFHAGTVQGQNTPLSPTDTESVAHVLATMRIPSDDNRFMSMYRTLALDNPPGQGLTQYSRKGPEANLQENPISIEAFQPEGGPWRMSDKELADVVKHETGHGLARRGYSDADYTSISNMLAASAKMGGVPFAGDPKAAYNQMLSHPNVQGRFKTAGGGGPGMGLDPKSKFGRYITSDPEVFAENITAYLSDPGAYKQSYPEAAAALRAIVNNNPRLNKYLTLSQQQGPSNVLAG